MTKFLVKKHLPLAFLGDGWETGFIDFRSVSTPEVLEIAKLEGKVKGTDSSAANIASAEKVYDKARELLKSHFIDGLGFTGEKDKDDAPVMAQITAEDAVSEELFDDIYVQFLKFARGVPAENL
jgi:hypothetical protein